MPKARHCVKFEKAKRKNKTVFIFVLKCILLVASCKVGKPTKEDVLPVNENRSIIYSDYSYVKQINIDSFRCDILYKEDHDSIELEIIVTNVKVDKILLGISSFSRIQNNNHIIDGIMPDINFHESMKLIDIQKGYNYSIVYDKFYKFDSYSLTFYIVNNWNGLVKCVKGERKIEVYKNEVGQDIWKLPHDEIPSEGITIITLSGISGVKNIHKILCEVVKY